MNFKGGNLTTDSGALHLRQLDDRLGLSHLLSSGVSEKRDHEKFATFRSSSCWENTSGISNEIAD